MIGVIKAYSTRVGGGPFPTEQENDIGQKIRDLEMNTVPRPDAHDDVVGLMPWPFVTQLA